MTAASCEAWVLQQLSKSSQSWMSLFDAYVANNGRFLRHGIPQQGCHCRHLHCLSPDTVHQWKKGLYFVCSRLESYHRCLIVSSAADLVCVFYNASLVNDF